MKSRREVADYRRALIDTVVMHVEQYGYCDVTDTGMLDDPPEHWLLRDIRIFEEANAARENRRPRLVPPETFSGALRNICKERGWDILWNSHRMTHYVLAPLRKVKCSECFGSGCTIPRIEIDDMSDSVIVTLCGKCGGLGYIQTRISDDSLAHESAGTP